MGFMNLFKHFLGKDWGVHPADHKRPASDVPTRKLPIPPRLHLMLSQHVGAPSRPIVLVGEKVRKGQLIAAAQGNISAPLHASTSGTISAIGEITAPHASGLPGMAISIDSDGEDAWIETEVITDPFSLSPEDIAKRVAAAGVVGLGGATFPSSVKLNLGRRSKIDTLIMNGSECEPYLSCDDRLMRDRAADIVTGIRLMLISTGAGEAKVGIEDNKPEAIAAMREAAARFDNVTIFPVPARYPMGSDRQLIVELTGREVPSDARAADVGVIVHNVGTAYAVQQAVCLGRPLLSRVMTLNGGVAATPGNYEVPLGTLISDLVAFTGGTTGEVAKLVMGGPMMGTILPHMRVPVIKGTSGILLLDANEAAGGEVEDCIRCGSCVKACPMGLLPLEMSARIRNDEMDAAADLGLADCIACGCCAYVCPSHIPLVQYFYHAKGDLYARERNKLRTEATKKMALQRQERLDREQREKVEAAAKRKAERAAAAAAAAAAEAAKQGESA
ncbi:electron transport complex subunit RsxC [Quatrionicoccus australiensis]|uniref:electron transport complex subunit RsxC n=1 Tax=Quatrionicoccus australiensis TaxID=138118 RepID=UPI001CFB154D|nr:electron transport complex subunit RsxC [Quatrionicoccus australiensis]MCB4361024.1 electron transport complex subunit RsxC [Quatrionicoccus australiensis]